MNTPPEPNLSEPHTPWQDVLIILLVVGGLVLATLFGVRLVHAVISLRHAHMAPGTRDVSQIQNWMTIPYIARTYRVPEETLWSGLGITPVGNRPKTLFLLNRDYRQGQAGEIDREVKAIVLAYQKEFQLTPPHIGPTQGVNP